MNNTGLDFNLESSISNEKAQILYSIPNFEKIYNEYNYKDIASLVDEEKIKFLKILGFFLWEINLLKKIKFFKYVYYGRYNKKQISQSDKRKAKANFKIFRSIDNFNSGIYGESYSFHNTGLILRIYLALNKSRLYSIKSKLFRFSIFRKFIQTTFNREINDVKINPEIPLGRVSLVGLKRGYAAFSEKALSDSLKNIVKNKNNSVNQLDGEEPDSYGIVVHSLPSGGAEKQAVLLVSALRASGKKAELLLLNYLHGDGSHHLSLAQSLEINPILTRFENYKELDYLLNLDEDELNLLNPVINPYALEVLNLMQAIRKYKIKNLISFLDNTNIVSSMVALLLEKNCQLSFRSYAPDNMNHVEQDRTRELYLTLKNYSRIKFSGNSHLGNEDYQRYLNLSTTPKFIENFVSGHKDISIIERNHFIKDFPNRKIDILGVFRFAEEKNIELFLSIIHELCIIDNSLNIQIYGEGKLKNKFISEIKNLDLERNVFVNSSTENISEIIHGSKIVLLTSLYEGMPNVIMESMTIGTPVASTEVGAVDFLSDNFRNIVKVNPFYLSETAKNIYILIKSPEDAYEMVKNSQQKIFNWRDQKEIAQEFLLSFDEN